MNHQCQDHTDQDNTAKKQQRLDIMAIESGLHPVMDVADPGIPDQDGLIYIASFRIE